MAENRRLRIAIVAPFFNEEAVLPEFFARIDAVLAGMTELDPLVLLVDDGSRDQGGALVERKADDDARYRLVSLSRNFGHQPALAAGLIAARDEDVDAVVTLDADLQDPPELIPELLAHYQAGAEVVLAVRRSRQEQGLRRLCFDLFHKGFNCLADFPIKPNTGTFGLLGREALAALAGLPERHRFFPGIRSWVGFGVKEVLYDRQERAAGKPAQSFLKLLRYALDAVFSFSYLPLRLLTYVGLASCGLGLVFATFFIVRRLAGIEIAFTGFTTLVTLVLFLGGAQLIGIGIIGEYLARVYDEVKQRPLYITKQAPGRRPR